MNRDPRVDAYIAARQPFAQPILIHLRELVHAHAPGAEETLKWGVPHFTLGGQNLAGMAAFKEHATFGFWRDEDVTGSARDTGAMGSMGRLATLADLPSDDVMAAYIAKAAALCAEGKAKRPAPKPKAALDLPDDLGAALGANAAAAGALGCLFAGQAPRLYRMGCLRRSARKRASSASKRSSRRSPRARTATGNIRAAEFVFPGEGRGPDRAALHGMDPGFRRGTPTSSPRQKSTSS